MDTTLMLLADIPDEAIPIVAIGGGLAIAAFAILNNTIRSVVQTRAREASRREIAAYVAEGSMSPDDAVRLLTAASPQEMADQLNCRSGKRA